MISEETKARYNTFVHAICRMEISKTQLLWLFLPIVLRSGFDVLVSRGGSRGVVPQALQTPCTNNPILCNKREPFNFCVKNFRVEVWLPNGSESLPQADPGVIRGFTA